MFIKSYQLIFLSTLVGGTLLAVSANSWFTSWLGLEINLMSVAPLMLIKVKKPLVEASIKYFLVQALASTMLIISVNILLISSMAIKMETMEILIFFALLMKAGIPPLHFWFPNIMNNLHWPQCFILFTWQKVAPLLLISCFKMNKIVTVAFAALTVGTIGGLNQLLTKTIMTYSSIAHSGWILMATLMSLMNWLFYFSIYCLLSASIIFMLWKSPLKSMNQMTSWKEALSNKYIFLLNMLSLGGLPPFVGFLAKLSVIIFMAQNNMSNLALGFVLLALISLFYYFRLVYSFSMSKQTLKHSYNLLPPSTNNTLLFSSLSLNVLIPAMNSAF